MAQCAHGIKRVTLELGGSDPMIICDDADLAAAASAASMGRFYNCGQACLAIKRVYVFESVADEVIESIVEKAKRLKIGRGDVKGTQMGPMHTAGGREEMSNQVSTTLNAGGELRTGGGPPDDADLADGFFYEPTIVADPPHDSPMATEEVFGPALPIWRVSDLDEAIERANASPVRPRVLASGPKISKGPARPPPASRPATPGSTRARRSTTSSRSAAGSRAATARSTARRRSTSTPRPSRSCWGRGERGVGRDPVPHVSTEPAPWDRASLPSPLIPLEHTFEGFLGLEWLDLTLTSAHVRFQVRENLKQPLGLMHGGIYSAVAETVASVATVNNVWKDGYVGSGLSNYASFLRPITGGTVDVTAVLRGHDEREWTWGHEFRDERREAVRARRRDDRGPAGPRSLSPPVEAPTGR